MAGLLSFAMMAGCGNNSGSVAEVQEDEDEKEDVKTPDEDEDKDEEKPADEKPEDPVEDPADEENKELDMPRSDAYEMFLAGEMDVTVWEDPNDPYSEYMIPAKGTYSYDELIDAILGEYPGKYDVKYTMFTPELGEEGDDIFVLYLENHDPSFYSWIGFIAYDTDGLNMRYCKEFGYRSFFDLYHDGYVLTGGSNGAGAQDFNCHIVLPDSSLRTLFKSSHLYSSWCGDITYQLDPDMDYELRPTLTYDSNLEMSVLYYDNGDVRFTVSGYSDNKAIKAAEENFVNAVKDMGAKEIDQDEYDSLTDVDVDESRHIDLSGLKTYDTVEKEAEY